MRSLHTPFNFYVCLHTLTIVFHKKKWKFYPISFLFVSINFHIMHKNNRQTFSVSHSASSVWGNKLLHFQKFRQVYTEHILLVSVLSAARQTAKKPALKATDNINNAIRWFLHWEHLRLHIAFLTLICMPFPLEYISIVLSYSKRKLSNRR